MTQNTYKFTTKKQSTKSIINNNSYMASNGTKMYNPNHFKHSNTSFSQIDIFDQETDQLQPP